MLDYIGREIKVGDKVKIIRCIYKNLENKVVKVIPSDNSNKIKVDYDNQWCGYHNPIDVVKVN